MSRLFGRTLREAPADAEMISHQLLLRAGMIRPLGAGIYTYMPLGWRVLSKIEDIMRQEMNAIGGQEMLMPVIHPAEIWQASGRWDVLDETLLRFRDRTGHDMVLAMTHEEVIADLLRREIDSYRRLPVLVYHVQTKFRDERRPRGGLIRVREFVMKDAYSLHAEVAGLEAFYPNMLRAYESIFERCAVAPIKIEADSGIMGGSASNEFVLLHERGEDEIVICDACGYAANAEQATLTKPDQPKAPLLPLTEIATPGCTTIEEVARFVGVPTTQTLKAVFLATEQEPQLVFAIIRGDLEVNEVKLSNAIGGRTLRKATEDEIRASGAVPGYASPIGLRERSGGKADRLPMTVVADDSIQLGSNFVTGANREGYHVTGANPGHDFVVDLTADIALARDGDLCPRCSTLAQGEDESRLRVQRGIELGHCFKLGTRYTAPANITYLAADGQERHIVMGSYGIGAGRLLASIVETHHDDMGIRWPISVAPYTVHLVSLVRNEAEVAQADALYASLTSEGIEVLYDDRTDLSAGVKFNDADLIGCPLRLTFSRRNLKSDSVEAKRRSADERTLVPINNAAAYVRQRLTT
jgi:prolyl-tRNA synthetase